MTPPDNDRRRSWAYARGLSRRIRGLETWQAEQRAVSRSWRVILPILLSAAAVVIALASLFYPRH